VISSKMREDLVDGKNLIVVNDNEGFILKANPLNSKIKEDLEFARRTEEAFKRVKRGEFVSVDSENLFEEMSKW
jgi:hypothetical protein